MDEDVFVYHGTAKTSRRGTIAGSHHAKVSAYATSSSRFLQAIDESVDSPTSDLLTLQWPSPPRNILMVKKNRAPAINESVIEFAKYGCSTDLST